MQITDCRADWTEDKGFLFPIHAAGNQYMFIQCLSPAVLHAPYCDMTLASGACIMFDKHVPLRIAFPKKKARFHWFFLQGDLTDMCERYGFSLNRIYNPDIEETTQMIRSIEKALLAKTPYFEDFCACKVCELFITLQQSGAQPQLRQNNTTLESLRASMIAHCADQWTSAQMCAINNLSESRLTKYYKQTYGITPKEDLAAIRIQHAKFMLLTQNRSIKEIAALLGFSSASAFSRSFKLHTGVLPSIYKHSL